MACSPARKAPGEASTQQLWGQPCRLTVCSPGLGAQPSPDVLRLKSSQLHKYNSHHIFTVKGKQSSITLLRTNLVFFLQPHPLVSGLGRIN